MQDRPWSNRQMEILAQCLRDNVATPEGAPDYDDVMIWYDELAAEVHSIVHALPWKTILPYSYSEVDITYRAKTIDTLRDKLVRLSSGPLSNIVDIAGVRVDAEMTLHEQDRVADAIARAFGMDPVKAVKDLRVEHHNGYRAVHVHLKLRRAMAEVQVRTQLQSKWANTYERLGDLAGRSIRYEQVMGSGGWSGIASKLQEISLNQIRLIEEAKDKIAEMSPDSGYVWNSLDDLPEEVREIGYKVLEDEAELSTMLDDVEKLLRDAQRKGMEQ